MASNTPWCPVCSDWRGYNQSLCKGCQGIEDRLLEMPGVTRGPGEVLCKFAPMLDADLTAGQIDEQKKAFLNARASMRAERFAAISVKRTEREAYTQMLEEFVDTKVDLLKTIAYDWDGLRRDAAQFKFSNMYVQELMEAMELALRELGATSLELTKYNRNKPLHDERMERMQSWFNVLRKFQRPDASEPIEEADVVDSNEIDDLPF